LSFRVSEQGPFVRVEFDDGQVSIVDPAHVAIASSNGPTLQLWMAGLPCWSIAGGEEGHAALAVELILKVKRGAKL
jgi:hypothetical protein